MIKSNIRYYIVIANFILAYTRIYKRMILSIVPDSILAELLVYLFLTIVSVLLVRKDLIVDSNSFKPNDLKEALDYVLAALLCSAIFSVFMHDANRIDDNSNNLNSIIRAIRSVFFAPVYEEIVCRLAPYKIIKNIYSDKMNSRLYILLTASIFSMLHIINYSGSPVQQMVPYLCIYFILGVALSSAYLKKNNIVFCIMIHSLWNCFMYLGRLLRVLFSS